MKISEISQMANSVWNSYSSVQQSSLSEFFHLRPTNSGVTVVSTLPFMPMRGINNIKSENSLINLLDSILNIKNDILPKDENLAKKEFMKLGFKERTIKSIKEEDYQAKFINIMNCNDGLKKILNTPSLIQFVASEFIYEIGKNKIDIVGFDGSDLYLFEFKNIRTTNVEQLVNYVNYFSLETNQIIIKKILSNYPIYPVKEFRNIKGVMTMPYAKNSFSYNDWNSIGNKNGIEIIFFDESMNFYKQ